MLSCISRRRLISSLDSISCDCPGRRTLVGFTGTPPRQLVKKPRISRSSSPLYNFPSGTQSSSFWTLALSAALLCSGLALQSIYTNLHRSGGTSLSELSLIENIEHSRTQEEFEMTTPAYLQEGHTGNLTAEQEIRLKELWGLLLKLCTAKSNGTVERQNSTPSDSGATEQAKPKKRGWFGRSTSTETPKEQEAATNGANGAAVLGSNFSVSDADDKFGLNKEFYAALASISPEELRLAFWHMVKHDNPDALLLRFLRARKWDVNKALVMLISAMRWRMKDMHVDDDLMKKGEAGYLKECDSSDPTEKRIGTDFFKMLRKGLSFVHGTDKDGRPICYIRVRLHKIGTTNETAVEKYTVYLIETSRLLMSQSVDTAALVFDLTDFSLSNMDYVPVKFMIKCFEANYPESLGIVLIHRAPWIFQSIWKVIKGWLDPVVAAKVHFTNNREELEQFASPDSFLKEVGGDDEYDYKYIEPEQDENSKMQDTAKHDELQSKRSKIYNELQEQTASWVETPNDDKEKNAEIKKKREALTQQLAANYWEVDPYVRARSMLDRLGTVKAGGPGQDLSHKASKASVKSTSIAEKKQDSTVVVAEAPATKAVDPVAAA